MLSSMIRSTAAIGVLVILALASCKKQKVYEGHPAVLYVFNGLEKGAALYGNYSDTGTILFSRGQRVDSKSEYMNVKFENPVIRARYFVAPDTLAKDLPVFDQELTLANGRVYTLYLAGDAARVDHLLIENKFKYTAASDSVVYMQVTNISNDQPISINVKGQPAGSLVSNLAYKKATDFLELKADHRHPSYDFEFRDAATGTLLLTKPVVLFSAGTLVAYKHFTLIFNGKRGASGADALNAANLRY